MERHDLEKALCSEVAIDDVALGLWALTAKVLPRTS